jgi:hypothetical protein
MSNNSGEKLTNFRNTISVVTAKFLNSMFGGLYGSSEGDLLDPNDPLVFGHVHDGVHADGHAQKIDLVDHVTNKLTGNNIANGTIQQYHLAFNPSTSPGGNDREIQFNDAGSFEGASTFKVNSSLDLELNTGSKFYFGNASLAYNPTFPDPELKFDLPLDGFKPGIINFTFDNIDTYNLTSTQFTPLSGISASLGGFGSAWDAAYIGDMRLENSEIIHDSSGLGLKPTSPAFVGRVNIYDQGASNFVSLESPASISSDYRIRLPDAIGSANQVLTVASTLGNIINADWSDVPSQDLFETITDGSTNIVASSPTDTLTLIAGTDISLSLNAVGKSVTINSTGGGGTPAGANGNMQFNNSGSFGGATRLNYDNASGHTTVDADFRLYFGTDYYITDRAASTGDLAFVAPLLAGDYVFEGGDIAIQDTYKVYLNSAKTNYISAKTSLPIGLNFGIGGSDEAQMTASAFYPTTPLAISLGKKSFEWGDSYLERIFVGDGSSTGVIISNSADNLILQTGGANNSQIELEDGVSGNVVVTTDTLGRLVSPKRTSEGGDYGNASTKSAVVTGFRTGLSVPASPTSIAIFSFQMLAQRNVKGFRITLIAQASSGSEDGSATAEFLCAVSRDGSGTDTRFSFNQISFVSTAGAGGNVSSLGLSSAFSGLNTATQTTAVSVDVSLTSATTVDLMAYVEFLNAELDSGFFTVL